MIPSSYEQAVKSAQSQVKSMEITENIHYSIKRYTAMVTTVYVLLSIIMIHSQYLNNTYPDLLIDKDKWEGPLNSLTNEIVVLIQKFSEMVNEDVLNEVLKMILVETNCIYLQ